MLSKRSLLLTVALLGCFSVAGCQPEEKITSGKRPRLNDMKRMLAAIVLPEKDGNEEKTWFFKLVGAESAIEPLVEPFQELLRSVELSNPDAPTWTLPPGWSQEKDKDKKFRYATIHTGPKGNAPELTVSSLPGKASVPMNVIRWRAQLGLKRIFGLDDDLGDFYRYEQIANRWGILVDMVGPGGADNMPPMHEPEPREPPFKYQTPGGWKEIPPTNELYVLSFRATSKGERADINVSVFPGVAGGLVDNVDRWRRQLGLMPMTQAEADGLPEVSIADAKGKLVDITGPDAPPQRNRIVGAILISERQSLFVKMMGPKEFVGKQKPAFETFLKSVKLRD